MENLSKFFLAFFIIISIKHTALCADTCEPTSCSPLAPPVHFPFRLGGQPIQCGYPRFDLSCSNRSELVLNLPFARDFVVTNINYTSQSINFKPKFCPVPRIPISDLLGKPYDFVLLEEYTLYNCSSTWDFLGTSFEVVDCVRNVNGTAVAVPSKYYNGLLPESCTNILSTMDVPMGFQWSAPFCGKCRLENMTCGYKNFKTLEIGCNVSSKSGISKAVEYGLIIGSGLPGLLLLICLAIFARKKINARGRIQQQNHEPDVPTTTIAQQTPRLAKGLDKLTIDSYPMTVLGESKRLPKPSDSTCAICLSEYNPNDALRTIPECNHYFHSSCIDEWLKRNATCPVCRNSPE
ncbi:Zinc finger, RING/FYVE/PHD-type [Heracleum sosnowskyi]|uniref:RING-type E3 ubiquitin transferase n=1 Tax=Heracleum sosnowskyi TaxID=360622 RepID=A0AAD8MR42_9APIA|nr:Zinc finger, RING/FYVE/PHD-type [Heracleum sosnowskyi]